MNRTDSYSTDERTPPFLAWSIRYSCNLKNIGPHDTPMQCERLLRPIRAYGDALHDGRIVQGICLSAPWPYGRERDSVKGFETAEALAAFGGPDHVRQSCSTCHVNIGQASRKSMFAGCYGECEIPDRQTSLMQRLEQFLSNSPDASLDDLFPHTFPRWLGLWIEPEVSGTRLQAIHALMRQPSFPCDTVEMSRLRNAVGACADHDLSLTVRLVPAGTSQRGQWRWDRHCERCKHSMTDQQRHCPACRKPGHGRVPGKRCARGSRPFVPLSVFLSPEKIESLLSISVPHGVRGVAPTAKS